MVKVHLGLSARQIARGWGQVRQAPKGVAGGGMKPRRNMGRVFFTREKYASEIRETRA